MASSAATARSPVDGRTATAAPFTTFEPSLFVWER